MTDKQTGGPAFPATEEHGCNSGWSGMDLRDYFAAKVIQGIVSHDPTFSKEFVRMAAQDAYTYADAMLKAREE